MCKKPRAGERILLLHGPKKRFFLSNKSRACVCECAAEKREKMNPLKSKRARRHTGGTHGAYTYNNIFAVHLFHFFPPLPRPRRESRQPLLTPPTPPPRQEGC